MKHYLLSLQNTIKRLWDHRALNNYNGDSYTYGQLATQIEKCHLFFEKIGVKKGEKIAICSKNTAGFGFSYLSVNTYETVIVPVLADFTPDSINHLVKHSESVGLFTNKDKWGLLDINQMPDLRFAIDADTCELIYCKDESIREAYNSVDSLLNEKYPSGFGPDDVVYPTDNLDNLSTINYTSGTSSAPKGVMLTYRNFSAIIDYSQRFMPCSEKDNMVSILPMAHMYGLVIEFLYPICSGVSVYWLGKTPTPTILLKALQEIKPYLFITVPLVMEKIIKSKVFPVIEKPAMKFATNTPLVRWIIFKKIRKSLLDAFGGNVKQFILGGAALNPEVEKILKKIRFPYTVGYGMTEAAPLLAYARFDSYIAGSCGRSVDCATVRIDSEDPHSIVGEIQAKGDNVCVGYFKNPEASENAFTEDGYLRTGDLGVIDSEGNIFIRGRSKNMLLGPSGQNIYPEEVEAVVNNCPYVLESVVVDRGAKLVALVYTDHQAIAKDLLDEEAISEIPENIKVISNKSLPSYSKITKVELMDAPFEKTPKMSIKRFLYK